MQGRLSASKMDRSKGGKGSNVKLSMISISVRKDVKLHEAENAWRPARLNRGDFVTDDDKKTAELYRKVRGILNKRTPQKFDTLLQQIKTLANTSARLQGVIDLVFKKAVDEPNFSAAYASMCGDLARLQVPSNASTEDKPDFVNFRKLLINRCQIEFEKQSVDENVRNQKLKEIEECTDPDKKKDLEFELEEYYRRLRMKSVGNIRFIGELFKQHMLNQNVIMRCLNILLENKDEESLECLCVLLTTIGKELENKQVSLASIFSQMKQLADKKEASKISSRIRFMLQDVIDLRNVKWVPRRQDSNPKMIDQIKDPMQGRLSASKMDRSKGGKGSNVKLSMISISVRKDVKLHKAENAWRPARLNKGHFVTDDDKKTAELYRKVRGILNKRTPQKFDTLLQQIKTLANTSARLQGVIDLVFEKAVDEPNFSAAYASMCGDLARLQVPSNASTEDKPDFVNFRKLLINRCQIEFEKQSVDENVRNQKLKEIEECTDPDKKKDLEFELEEYYRRLRMKSVGNIRFIGELFKQQMLTQNIMMRCLNILLENKDEESLECLCVLLTTIGKELENKQVSLSSIFSQMKQLADKKEESKISSRIRFMLQDVIDLRNSKWVPRRQVLNPKLIDQIKDMLQQYV